MKAFDLLAAMDLVEERYLTEALTYRGNKRKTVRILAGLAACMVIGFAAAALIIPEIPFMGDGPCLTEGSASVEDGGSAEYSGGAPLDPSASEEPEGYPIFTLYADGEEFVYEPAPLYVATVVDAEMDAYVSEEFAREMHGITLFTAGDEDPSGAPTWYPVMADGQVSKFYWFYPTGTGYGRGWMDGNEVETMINALASQTSEENPLYLVRSQEMLFAVIGDIAYYLPGSTFEPEEEYLPEIQLDGYEITVICLE